MNKDVFLFSCNLCENGCFLILKNNLFAYQVWNFIGILFASYWISCLTLLIGILFTLNLYNKINETLYTYITCT